MKYYRILKAYTRVSLSRMVSYRADILFRFAGIIPVFLILIFLFSIPFQYQSELAGWKKNEILVVLGMYYIAEGVAWSTFKSGIGTLERMVSEGTFDCILIKPVSPAYVLSLIDIDSTRIADIVVGSFLIVWVLMQSSIIPGVWEIAGTLVSFVAGLAVSYSLYLSVNTIVFWTTHASVRHVLQPVYGASRYPAEIWGEAIGRVLVWMIPLGLIAGVPAGMLVGKLGIEWAFYATIIAMVWIVGARLFWRTGLKLYVGVGS